MAVARVAVAVADAARATNATRIAATQADAARATNAAKAAAKQAPGPKRRPLMVLRHVSDSMDDPRDLEALANEAEFRRSGVEGEHM